MWITFKIKFFEAFLKFRHCSKYDSSNMIPERNDKEKQAKDFLAQNEMLK